MKSAFKLVRWIMVVTLGCSLGLIFVYFVRSTRMYRDAVETTTIIRRTNPAEPPFKISQESLENELQRVVEAQLTAFREDDYPKAYEFAASSIKAQVSLPAFERMVKSGYPLIAHNRAVQFGVVVDNGDHAVASVTVLSEGRTRHYQYILQHERTGWKIAGVAEVKAVGTTI